MKKMFNISEAIRRYGDILEHISDRLAKMNILNSEKN